jgi:TonB-linked SusC/RagA family outer membrane protein
MKNEIQNVLLMSCKFIFYGGFLQVVFISLLFADPGNAKEQLSVRQVYVNLNLEDARITDLFKAIESQTNFKFFYDRKIINRDLKFDFHYNEASIHQILLELSRQAYLKFKQVNNTINVRENSDRNLNPESAIEIVIQTRNVSGRVTSQEDGLGLPGVNVIEKGTSNGTVTDVQGQYSLEVFEGATLVFSSVGYISEEVAVGTRSVIDLVMSTDVHQLEELVVIGYGTVRRRDLTGSVASISERDFADKPVSNISQALAGRIPGLDVVSSGALPGDTDQIRLRGRRSFVASNEPLIILDGTPFYGSLNDINPYDIQSIDVLKDASATSIYGSQGANGVIIVTSKRGNVGPPRFMVESFVGRRTMYGRLPVQNVEQFAERKREAYRTAGDYPDPGINDALDAVIMRPVEYETYKAGAGVDWQDLYYDHVNMFQHKHQLTVMGGSESFKYNIAGNLYKEEGIVPTRQFDRYSLRTNLDYSLSPRVNFGSSFLLSYNERHSKMHPGALSEVWSANPLGKLYEDDGTPRYDPSDDGFAVNPLSDFIWDSYRWNNRRWNAYINLFAIAEIIPDLTYRINLNTNMNLGSVKEAAGRFSRLTRGQLPMATIDNFETVRNIYESILSYNKFFGDDHHITATAVHSIQTSRTEASGSSVRDLPYEISRYHNIGSATDINFVSSDLNEWNLLSYVGRLFYGYKSKYLLTMSLRADGASQFAPDHKWGYFPSLAVAWNASEEPFLNGIGWLSNLKLRLSYGVTGNQAIEPYQTQGGLTTTTYTFDGSPGYGMRPVELANRDLKWESTDVYNIGLDFGFFQGRINGNLELYTTNTYDLLMYRQLPITTGFDQVLENVGNTRNRGIELGLNTFNIDRTDFRWNTNLSFYLNREEIVELYAGKEDDIGNRWFIGHPIHVYYDFEKIGIWQLEEANEAASYGVQPGSIKLRDVNNDGAITDDDRLILGSREPNFVFNISNSLNYNNWDLKFDFYTRWGNMTRVSGFMPAPSGRANQLVFDYWTPTNPTNHYPRPDARAIRFYQGETLMYRDGSFMRLRQLSLGYRLPDSFLDRFNLSNLRLYITAENPWYWTKSELRSFNMEPEWSEDAERFPATRNFVFGINIGF